MNLPSVTRTIVVGAAPAAGLATFPAAAQDKPCEDATVNMARPTCDTGWWQAEVYRQMLQELGYEVPQITTLDYSPFYQIVAQRGAL